MGKTFLLTIGLLVVISLVLVGCTTGEAVRSSNLCAKVKECGATAQGSEPVFITFDEISKSYGNMDFQFESGAEVCRKMGYRGCLMSEMRQAYGFYESTDGSCKNSQYRYDDYAMLPCEFKSQNFQEGCEKTNMSWAVEPENGDKDMIRRLHNVVCLR